jgi:hypothetical protein
LNLFWIRDIYKMEERFSPHRPHFFCCSSPCIRIHLSNDHVCSRSDTLPNAAVDLLGASAALAGAALAGAWLSAGAALSVPDRAGVPHADRARAAIMMPVTNHNFDFMLFPPLSNDYAALSHVEWYCLDLNDGC